ncbi:MAG: YegS/Rv2252/BmrU family lipid kinase [Spirochaetes bacterium]|nr:YegS/Rv2252/BmrU family lipid kinase [Spirochaetota bacterium]
MINNYKFPIIIYNPHAASGIAPKKKTIERYIEILKKENLFKKIDTYPSKSKGDTINKIAEIHKDKKNDLIISIGGDGSLSTICNGLMKIPIEKRLPIFPLPTGTGNSLVRDFKIFSINDSIKHYKTEEPKMFDIIHVKGLEEKLDWYCINVLGMGFISDIANYVETHGKTLGHFSYMLGTILALGNYKPYNIEISYENNKKFESKAAYLLTFSNTKFTGGHIKIAPFAEYNDNLIDVVVLYELNRLRFLKGFAKLFVSKHIYEKGCAYFKANSLIVKSEPKMKLMLDGDLFGSTPVKLTILPKQLKLVL